MIAAITVNKIGLILKRIFATAVAIKSRKDRIEMVVNGLEKSVDKVAPGNTTTPIMMVIAAAAIKPTAAGLIPARKPFMILFSR